MFIKAPARIQKIAKLKKGKNGKQAIGFAAISFTGMEADDLRTLRKIPHK